MRFPALSARESKQAVVEKLRAHLEQQGFIIAEMDAMRPWGAFIRIVNEHADKFIETYFSDVAVPADAQRGERSPKILLVAPQQRLSWQYHHRRAELWRAANSDVGVYLSDTDTQPDEKIILRAGQEIELPQGTRHRLVGLETWGAVAEIWIHTDAQNLSNEDDIVRLQDDYARH